MAEHLQRRGIYWRTIDQRYHRRIAAAVERFLQANLQRTELAASGIFVDHQRSAFGINDRRQRPMFFPTTTRTKSVAGERERIAAERNVSPDRALLSVAGGHGSRALSLPMREESPAARIIPAKLAAMVMR